MIYHMEEYESLVRKILQKMPVVRTEQLVLFLKKTFMGITDDAAMHILVGIQRKGYVLLSIDGWAMKKSIYVELTGDDAFAELLSYGPYRLRFMEKICREFYPKRVKLLWLIADLAPMSEEFFLSEKPWDLVFVSEDNADQPARIYEFIYISAQGESAAAEMLRTMPKIKEKEDRESIIRIALMENSAHSYKIPYRGFRYIAETDDSSPAHYRITERRKKEEAWKDE